MSRPPYQRRPEPARLPDRFLCQTCESQVIRRNRPAGDDSICLNCWYGRLPGALRAPPIDVFPTLPHLPGDQE